MTQMLELSKREFKISTINMLRTLMERVDNKQEQKGNISREVETLRQNQKAKAVIIFVLKYPFVFLISRIPF